MQFSLQDSPTIGIRTGRAINALRPVANHKLDEADPGPGNGQPRGIGGIGEMEFTVRAES